MRILFGPENDGLHIAPDTPGAYEWWYFDALSDDGRFALVVIFFLGTPMSPYYKAVVDGKNPLPQDWCGVFFSLHESVGPARTADGHRVRSEWAERAYTYNLYRNGHFASDGAQVTVGTSTLVRTDTAQDGAAWHLSLEEANLWQGRSKATVHFTSRTRLDEPEAGADNYHSWVCVAPVCRVSAECSVGKRTIRFSGHGYHDHNFGVLPWFDTDIWYWGRAQITRQTAENYHVVYYADVAPGGRASTSLLLFDNQGRLQNNSPAELGFPESWAVQRRNAYGFRSASVFSIDSLPAQLRAISCTLAPGALSGGPFYERSPVQVQLAPLNADYTVTPKPEVGTGIAEAFRPARLCGPIASRAMWTRMRRRS